MWAAGEGGGGRGGRRRRGRRGVGGADGAAVGGVAVGGWAIAAALGWLPLGSRPRLSLGPPRWRPALKPPS